MNCEHRCPRGLSALDCLLLGFLFALVVGKLDEISKKLDNLKPKAEAAQSVEPR